MTKSELLDPTAKRVRAEVRPGQWVTFVRKDQPSGAPEWVSRASQAQITTRSLLRFPLMPQEPPQADA